MGFFLHGDQSRPIPPEACISLQAILVTEEDAPPEVEAIEWLLLTTLELLSKSFVVELAIL